MSQVTGIQVNTFPDRIKLKTPALFLLFIFIDLAASVHWHWSFIENNVIKKSENSCVSSVF